MVAVTVMFALAVMLAVRVMFALAVISAVPVIFALVFNGNAICNGTTVSVNVAGIVDSKFNDSLTVALRLNGCGDVDSNVDGNIELGTPHIYIYTLICLLCCDPFPA